LIPDHFSLLPFLPPTYFPANILISNTLEVKVADFGITQSKKGKELAPMVGHKDHMAPEIIFKGYREPVDIWSFGVLACHVLGIAHGLKGETKVITEDNEAMYVKMSSFI
jgi:serine/threonine protein kinase